MLLTTPSTAAQNNPPTPSLTQQSATTLAYQDEEQQQEKIPPYDEYTPEEQFTDTDLTGHEDNDQKQPSEPDNCNDNLQPEPDMNLFG